MGIPSSAGAASDSTAQASPPARDALRLLERLAVLNRDDGSRFTDARRLEAVGRALEGFSYSRANSRGLFHLYASKPIEELPDDLVVVSSHVDCEAGMDRCFAEDRGDGLLKGTFDNLATNAAIVAAMRAGDLPRNVVVAFTGDEERESAGARQVCEFVESCGKRVSLAVVLDVTDMGWGAKLDFTVENDFCDEELVARVAGAVSEVSGEWEIVPAEIGRTYEGIPQSKVTAVPAMPDESWEYDERGVPCFSLCVPVEGDMHSGAGVLMRKDGFMRYVEMLQHVLLWIAV